MPVSILPNRSLIRVSGAEAMHFLHNLVTGDIEGLGLGELVPGALLTPQGKILFDFLVSRDGDALVLECLTDIAGDFAKRLKFYRLRAKVDIELQEQALVSVGFQNESGASGSDSSSVGVMIDRRFSNETNVRRHYGTSLESDAGEAVYDHLRIQNGIAEGGSDYAFGDMFPHDVNLDQIKGVSFSKGCYVGQEVVSRMHHRGTARRRVLIASGAAPLAAHAEMTVGGRVIGALGSAVGNKALALVRIDKAKNAMDTGTEILAGDVPISLTLPPNVTFSWPETLSMDE